MIDRISDLEVKYVNDVLKSQFRTSAGAKYMKALEKKFAQRFNSPFSISFVNGTATMHAALEAMGLSPGDEVIVPPLTMASTAFAVLQCNATPIFADVDPLTFQICTKSILERITPRTKAIITVALYGGAPDMAKIRSICDSNDLFLLEDNAECFLGEIDNKLIGSFGDFASFSFQSSKHITSGEGGMLLVKSEVLANKVRAIQSLGYIGVSSDKAKITKDDIQNPEYSRHGQLGWNYRMPELCCAVALGQLERIDELVNARVVAAKRFSEVADKYPEVITPQSNLPNSKNSYWCWSAVLREDINWADFRRIYNLAGGKPFYSAWKLTYLEPMFAGRHFLGRERFVGSQQLDSYRLGLCPIAESLQPRMIQIPTNFWCGDDAVPSINALAEACKHFQ